MKATPAATLPQPWYREPWPWIIMSGPAVVVVAGIVTPWIAFSGADGLVADDYYKRGLAINRTLERIDAAVALGLQAELSRSAAGDVAVRLRQSRADAPPLPASIRLRIVHPTRASEDRTVELTATDAGVYTGRLEVPGRTQWHVLLETAQWRLEGVWPASGAPVTLDATR